MQSILSIIAMAGVRGIEPRFQVLETYALTAVLYPFVPFAPPL